MAAPQHLAALLLDVGRTAVIELDARQTIQAVHNPLLLDEWRDAGAVPHPVPGTLPGLLAALFGAPAGRELMARLSQRADMAVMTSLQLGTLPLPMSRGGSGGRHVALSLHATGDESAASSLLVLRDVSMLAEMQQSLARAQQALDAAVATLRAPSHALRLFLGSALTCVATMRATLRMPARDRDALLDKLARVHAAVAQLGREADALRLTPVQDACQSMIHRLSELLEQEEPSGDALLPLAVCVDRIASSAAALSGMEETRHVDAAAQAPTPARVRRQPDWSFASERRWASFLRHRGEELGLLVTLRMEGAALVPRTLRVSVDDLLKHLLRNAVEHGIDTPEERLTTGKPAGASITVKFEAHDTTQLRMVVQDDGRGRGLGLAFLRRAAARLGGQVAVAAKPGQYTRFVIDLPLQVQQEQQASQTSP